MVNAKNIKTKRKSKKLDHKMRGPFKVKRLIGSYAYEFVYHMVLVKFIVFIIYLC